MPPGGGGHADLLCRGRHRRRSCGRYPAARGGGTSTEDAPHHAAELSAAGIMTAMEIAWPGWICHSSPMRVHIGSDHAGFELKTYLIEALTEDGHEVVDHGPDTYDAEDDYPVYCIPAAEAVVADPGSLCIVIGGSGNGEQIAANKVVGTRAALAYNLDTARLGRE